MFLFITFFAVLIIETKSQTCQLMRWAQDCSVWPTDSFFVCFTSVHGCTWKWALKIYLTPINVSSLRVKWRERNPLSNTLLLKALFFFFTQLELTDCLREEIGSIAFLSCLIGVWEPVRTIFLYFFFFFLNRP